jgi:hypothetical protein
VVAHGDANAAQGRDHIRSDGKVLLLHSDVGVDNRDDWPEPRMHAEKLVLRRRLADGNRNDAGGASAFDAVQIAPQGAIFLIFGVELLLDLRRTAGGGVVILGLGLGCRLAYLFRRVGHFSSFLCCLLKHSRLGFGCQRFEPTAT